VLLFFRGPSESIGNYLRPDISIHLTTELGACDAGFDESLLHGLQGTPGEDVARLRRQRPELFLTLPVVAAHELIIPSVSPVLRSRDRLLTMWLTPGLVIYASRRAINFVGGMKRARHGHGPPPLPRPDVIATEGPCSDDALAISAPSFPHRLKDQIGEVSFVSVCGLTRSPPFLLPVLSIRMSSAHPP